MGVAEIGLAMAVPVAGGASRPRWNQTASAPTMRVPPMAEARNIGLRELRASTPAAGVVSGCGAGSAMWAAASPGSAKGTVGSGSTARRGSMRASTFSGGPDGIGQPHLPQKRACAGTVLPQAGHCFSRGSAAGTADRSSMASAAPQARQNFAVPTFSVPH